MMGMSLSTCVNGRMHGCMNSLLIVVSSHNCRNFFSFTQHAHNVNAIVSTGWQHYQWNFHNCLGLGGSFSIPGCGDTVNGTGTGPVNGTANGTIIGIELAITSEGWFVDWDNFKCKQSCDGPLPCGGVANYDQELYATAELCCLYHLSWISPRQCTKYN